MSIRVLTTNTINKIAAGEVVDRPLSVVKELVENSIDAGATEIEVEISRGGRNFISVTDNGKGIKKDEIELALERHATSKLKEEDISNIQYLGFRGEALPSIAAVSKLKIMSKAFECNEAWEIEVIGGEKSKLKPISRNVGTTIQVKDLFFSTPTRLKFLKSEASETSASIELLNKLALSRENISFKLISNDKVIVDTKAQDVSILDSPQRLEDIIGKKFIDNAIKFFIEDEEIKVHGYASIPTYNAATSLNQHFFINKRFVKDKVLSIAVKAAYRNLIPHNRFPQIALYLDIDPKFVDVNVHPTKAEVRFRDGQKIKGIIINAIRTAISKAELMNNKELANDAVRFFKPQGAFYTKHREDNNKATDKLFVNNEKITEQQHRLRNLINSHEAIIGEDIGLHSSECKDNDKDISDKKNDEKYLSDFIENEIERKNVEDNQNTSNDEYPLGFAKCQIDKTYIVAEKSGSLILVDQHAAHERLTLEKMKVQLKKGKVESQILLIPEIVELGKVLTEEIIQKKDSLKAFGLIIERNGISQILIRQVPSIFLNLDINSFVRSIAENIYLFDDIELIHEKIEEIWGNIACHSSIRAGRVLNLEEMNALLRQIEQTSFSEQCNHGRPTFIKLEMKDIRKIFERL
jgi:DNA mismatch repair protein MutL